MEETESPFFRAQFREDRSKGSPLWDEKPQNRPVTNRNIGVTSQTMSSRSMLYNAYMYAQ